MTLAKPIFFSFWNRNEIIKAYEDWKNGEGPAKGTFSNGEKYNFENGRTSSIWARNQEKKEVGKKAPVEKTEVDSWELVYRRSKAISENPSHQDRTKQFKAEFLAQGRALAGIKGTTDKSDEELIEDGKNIL